MPGNELLEELRKYVEQLDPLARRIIAAFRKRAPATIRQVLLRGAAGLLEDYYSSCERIFEAISRGFNGGPPDAPDWHRVLLERMTLSVPRTRPAVLSPQTQKGLDKIRGFRHAMRHLYGIEIDEHELRLHLRRLPALHRDLRAELTAFLEKAESILKPDEGRSRAIGPRKRNRSDRSAP